MSYNKTDLELDKEQTALSLMTIFVMENRLMIICIFRGDYTEVN